MCSCVVAVLQFGFVTLFASAFPLAALLAFINNVIEMRSDLFKLTYALQRPHASRAENIGTAHPSISPLPVVSLSADTACCDAAVVCVCVCVVVG